MKLAIATAAALLAASSFALAADNNGGKNDNGKDNTTTNSITNDRDKPDMDDAKACREGTSGGAVCQEPGTMVDPM